MPNQMNFISHIVPHTTTYHSKINGEIKVTEFMGKTTLYCGEVTQSGGFTVKMWEEALKRVQSRSNRDRVQSCLVLGLGGGTVIRMLEKSFSKIRITAVDIDPVMVRIAQKHFFTGTSPHTSVVVADALDYVSREYKNKFDLIIVDLYLGKLNPAKSHGRDFLANIKKLLEERGLVLFNANYQSGKMKEYDSFLARCRELFDRVEEIDSYLLNRLLILHP